MVHISDDDSSLSDIEKNPGPGFNVALAAPQLAQITVLINAPLLINALEEDDDEAG